ncbi:MAG: hypothetical protein IT160_21180 [Bryobacterales bacterium]|nr:hypothetical protein [Bryobacterales bacterium]
MNRRRLLAVLPPACFALGDLPANASWDAGLIAHWKLLRDARDSSGNGHHGKAQGVRFTGAEARFDGRGAHIEVAHGKLLDPGAKDFTISAWIRDDDVTGDLSGGIVTKYDPQLRRGFGLSLLSNSGVTSDQANHRNLQFGIDAGRSVPEWADCGRPGAAIFIWHLLVHDGALYAATCEAGETEAGHVYRYESGQEWVDCGSPDRSNSVESLIVYEGRIYAGTSRYNLGGSQLPVSPNQTAGGKIYRYEGGRRWIDCGRPSESVAIGGMAVFRGKLYVSAMYHPAGVYRYEGGQRWAFCGNANGNRVNNLIVFDGELYGTGWDTGQVYRYSSGTNWETAGKFEGVQQTYGFAVYDAKLFVSTWPRSEVFRRERDNRWVPVGRLGNEKESMGMAVYNGKLYSGTLPLAQVYRYDGGQEWTNTGQLDATPDVTYRRAWSMAVFQGKLFCGTLPSGHVYAMEEGKCATIDRALRPGWRHVMAVRKADRLKLWIDGEAAAASGSIAGTDYDISNDRPLLIGLGVQDSFRGALRDLRIYNRAVESAS